MFSQTAPSGLSIGRLSKLTGCHRETIRYYERIGLMPEPPRSTGGHRLYDGGHQDRLKFICRSRALGFTLDEVRRLLSLADGTGNCAAVRAVALDHLAELRAKIADLERIADTLCSTADQCEDGASMQCPILEALSDGVKEA